MEWRQGFLLDRLLATLKDAVVLTRDLGIEYIWIDALCIVQDSRLEWAAEARKMMAYYANAYVTIVPKLSKGSGDGFGGDPKFAWPTPSRFSGPWSSGWDRSYTLQKDVLQRA